MLEVAGCLVAAGFFSSVSFFLYERKNAAYLTQAFGEIREQLVDFEKRYSEINQCLFSHSRQLSVELRTAHRLVREVLEAGAASLREGELLIESGQTAAAEELLSRIEAGDLSGLREGVAEFFCGASWWEYVSAAMDRIEQQLEKFNQESQHLVPGDLWFLQDLDEDYLA